MYLRLYTTHSVAAVLILISVVAGSAQEAVSPAGRRIVGGVPTDIARHPWQVALNIKAKGQIFLCGGSLVAERWVLTAAHCFELTAAPRDIIVKAGVTDYLAEGKWQEVEKVAVHPAYNNTTQENDIALVRLSARSKGQIVALQGRQQSFPVGEPLEVSGWGATREDGDASRRLLQASVPYVDNTTCNAPEVYAGQIKPGMMCAGFRDGGVDSCQGDSGGPLVWRTKDGPVLVGVVSWGDGCARKLRYGVYTRAASYADWIRKVVSGG